MPFTLLQTTLPVIGIHEAVDAAVILVVGVGKIWNMRTGRRRDGATDKLTGEVRGLRHTVEALSEDVTDLTGDVKELRAFAVGIDGENGIRGDVREIKERVIGLENREREQLADDRLHGRYRKD